MREILAEIQTGDFARELILENQADRPMLTATMRSEGRTDRESGQKAPEDDAWIDEGGLDIDV